MASVSEMYDVGWEGKTKDTIHTLQVSLKYICIFIKHSRLSLRDSMKDSCRSPKLEIQVSV